MNNPRIKEGFVLRKMFDNNIVMPAGSQVKGFKGVLVLNDTGALIYEQLKAGKSVEETAQALTDEYVVTLEKALADVQKTVADLQEAGVAE